MTNPFSSASLGGRMANSVPRATFPQLKDAVDVLALAAHATMLAVDFRLIGLGEEDRIEASSDSFKTAALPAMWNATSGSHSFRYAHPQSSMEYLLKLSKMGSKVVVMGLAVGDDKTCSFDVAAKEYVLEGNLPSSPLSEDTTEETATENIIKLFLAYDRLSDFGSLMLIKIIQKLAPGITKGGQSSEEGAESSSQIRQLPSREPERPNYDPLREDRDPPARPYPFNDPLAIPRGPRRPLPEPIPGFEDEYETQRPLRGGFPGGAGFPRIGGRDLYPAGLGPNDPLRGGVGPGLDPMGGGGGMHPTFDDPLFTGQGRRGQGYGPQNPPGSRYDPVGPALGGHPRGAGMGGRPPNPFGGFGDGDFL